MGRTVGFTLGTGGSAQTCSGVTNALGTASCTIAMVNQPLGPGVVSASFAGDPYYLPSNVNATTIVFQWTTGGNFVIGNANATIATSGTSPTPAATSSVKAAAARSDMHSPDSAASMPMSRTRTSAPPTTTSKVSPSRTRVTVNRPGSASSSLFGFAVLHPTNKVRSSRCPAEGTFMFGR